MGASNSSNPRGGPKDAVNSAGLAGQQLFDGEAKR